MLRLNLTESNDFVALQPNGAEVVFNDGDVAWLLTSTALVFIMSPGVGFFYSGLMRRKNALNQIFLSLAIYAVVTFEYFFWGYSLAFSDTAGKFIGDLKQFAMINTLAQPSVGSSRVPALGYALYQLTFATITPVLAFGATAERGRTLPTLVAAFLWATIVYNVVACWTWNPAGWIYKMGGLDFAGGGPVHMTSGTAALAYSLYLGKRRGWGTEKLAYLLITPVTFIDRPNSVNNVVIGTVFLWFGWFGFNGGSALSADLRAIQASMVTNMAASVGGLTWCFVDYYFERKLSVVGFCSGVIAGLIGITPAAGYVGTPAAIAIGVLVGVGCNMATKLKVYMDIDDTLDIFATHACGRFIGSICTGIFADSRVVAYDLSVIDGGWVNRHFIQVGYQLAGAVATVVYTFFMTLIILILVDHLPGCSLRVSVMGEVIGLDEDQNGEFAYDYTHVHRNIEFPEEHKKEILRLKMGEEGRDFSEEDEEKSIGLEGPGGDTKLGAVPRIVTVGPHDTTGPTMSSVEKSRSEE